MKIRTGIDILDIPKFAENLKSEAFIRKVFTLAEIAACERDRNPRHCYAVKFAVKEAFMKAIGQGIRQEVWFTQIEVLVEESGRISVVASGQAKKGLDILAATQIAVSIAESDDLVVATIVLGFAAPLVR